MIIVFIIIFIVTLVCSMEIYASLIQEESFILQDIQCRTTEGDTVNKQTGITVDATGQVMEVIEDIQESTSVVTEERQNTERAITIHTEESAATTATFVPSKTRRIVTVGNLPEDHDPSLVLRKGRTFVAILIGDINNRISLEGECSFTLHRNVYDDSGQVLLMPIRTVMRCVYKISEQQDKLKINITATDMYLDLYHRVSVRFSDPPLFTTRVGHIFTIEPLNSANMRRMEEESLRLREQLFLSPVISTELVLGVGSEDHTSKFGKVIFGENASGDRTIFVETGYRANLYIGKDILFSGPFIPRGGSMKQLIERNR
jgi:hypothetical protein